MNMQNWPRQHQAIKDLIAYLDETLPKLNSENSSGSVFTGAAALYRCNRYLRAIDDAVSGGVGDTAGGNLRTLYETWIVGHLLLLSELEELERLWGDARHLAQKVINVTGADVTFPDETPEAAPYKNTEALAHALGKRLGSDDPENATMPTHCYDFIYRSESLLSAHANLTATTQYARTIGKHELIGLHSKNEGCEWRTVLAGYITAYFALRLFKAAGIDDARLEKINEMLDPNLDDLPRTENAK